MASLGAFGRRAGGLIGGIFLPGTISDRVAKAYDDVLFKGAKLRDLPDDAGKKAPRFVINATYVQTSALWRFSRPFMGDVPLCTAVAASSAIPPILSPMTLPIHQAVVATRGADLNRPPYTQRAVLSDGGVYDNLGLETVKRYTTLLVSACRMTFRSPGGTERGHDHDATIIMH